VSVLGAADAAALLEWLQVNEYQVSSDAKEIFDDYIDRNWAFVAVKLDPSGNRQYWNEFLPPLTIKYRYNQLIFPLLISSISTTEQVRITLYIIAGSAVKSSNFRTAKLVYNRFHPMSEEYIETCIQNTLGGDRKTPAKPLVKLWRNWFNPDPFSVQEIGDEGKALAKLWSGKFCPDRYFERSIYLLQSYPDPSLGLKHINRLCSSPLPECELYLTRLEARMKPADMTEDIYFEHDTHPADFEVRFER
jgi:hypothetical protein